MTVARNVPWEYQNCSKEYRGEGDNKYLECDELAGKDLCLMLKEMHTAKDLRRGFLGVLPLILTNIAILLNVIFIASVVFILRRRKTGSRKRYAFMLSRCVSAFMALLLVYVVLLLWRWGNFDYTTTSLLIMVGMTSFLTLTATYLTMTTLLYMAVVHPLKYRTCISMHLCLLLIGTIWAGAILLAAVVGALGGTLFFPETAPFACDYASCQKPLAISMVGMLSAAYALVLICYAGMVCRMHAGNQIAPTTTLPSPSEVSTRQRNMRAMHRLGCNLLLFALLKVPLLVLTLIALCNLEDLHLLGVGQRSHCKTFLHGALFFKVELLGGLASIVGLTGLLCEPIINVLNDPPLRLLLMQGKHSAGRFLAQLSRRQLDSKYWREGGGGSMEEDPGEF